MTTEDASFEPRPQALWQALLVALFTAFPSASLPYGPWVWGCVVVVVIVMALLRLEKRRQRFA
ncbi:hypothetical protein MUU72_31745 [Streptomyces sp. RS10V-4]|uniref:hypothetical protein n=1 Tax=Streptomyces rhizoryzae TaxID=2932493 RepID=UPI0020031725|nr:hypothetical protein [Streptomyces rhizoryzae]MCK7627616.1 hypothetical protein [Streptomyces rhizoryzae]